MVPTSKGLSFAYSTVCVLTAIGDRSTIVHSQTIVATLLVTRGASMRFIFFLFSLIVVSSIASAAPPALRQSGFEPNAKGEPIRWTTWAARPEIAPRTFVAHDSSRNRGDAGSLAVAAEGNPAAYGGWEGLVADIQPEKWYRFTACYQAEGLTDESLQIVARLDWSEASGKRAGRPDYAYTVTDEGGWKRVRLEAPAPAEAAAVKIQLFLSHSANGRVWWDDVSLSPIETPSARLVRVASVNLQPRKTGSREISVGRFLDVVESRVPEEADIILLPEGITVVGTGKSYSEVAEPIPGPTTQALAEAARAKKAYLAAGIYERDGQTIYNTAVLLDRQGEVVGKYRKVYLPREEIEGGLTPGDAYPVFTTDFGKVGLMICWDIQYADPARALALAGAELLLTPIWGGNEALGKARAIENHVFVATSGYNYPTLVMDPDGEILAQAEDEGTVALTTIDLNKRYVDPWLGHMRGRFMNELRLDVPVRPSAH